MKRKVDRPAGTGAEGNAREAMSSAAPDATLVRTRLANQRLGRAGAKARTGESAAELVRWMGAVQAQDFAGGLWAVGMRLAGSAISCAEVESALAERSIVRSWPMRGTLHFVPAEDLRWMLRLLAPRITAGLGWRDRQLGLDATSYAQAERILTHALEGGRCLSRPAAYAELERGGIATGAQRGIHILGNLSLTGRLCFGARDGKQPTFVLLDEWLPRERDAAIDDDEGFARIAETYFRGHGPATLADFAWWTGLRLAEAERAIEIAGKRLNCETRGEVSRYTAAEHATAAPRRSKGPSVELLPPWDEYLVGYRDRSAALGHLPDHAERKLELLGRPIVLVDGRARGFWKREVGAAKTAKVRLTLEIWESPDDASRTAMEVAAKRYAAFLGRELDLRLAKSPKRRTR